tara:strand:- start:1160 stop:1369 length:210 start_codon:yes stop_codon:yes gene_type:complete
MKLEFELYFKDSIELTHAISKVKDMISKGIMEHNGRKYKYRVMLAEAPDMRYDVIDGVKYLIIPSKMNK